MNSNDKCREKEEKEDKEEKRRGIREGMTAKR